MTRVLLTSLMVVASLSGLVAVNAQTDESLSQRQKRKMLQDIRALRVIPVNSDNSQGSSLFIQEASVREITETDFTLLSGETSRHPRHSTFPDVTLVNGSGKTIKSFGIAVQSAVDKSKTAHGLIKYNLSIPPNDIYKVTSKEWPRAERLTVEKKGEFVNVLRQPGLDSPKSWIPGAASDLTVTVGFIEYEDGTRWMISRDSGL